MEKDRRSIREKMNDYHFSVYDPKTKKTTYPYRKDKFDTKWLLEYGHPYYYC